MSIRLRFKRLVPSSTLPSYSHIGDSGMDVRSVEAVTIFPGNHALIDLGLAAEIPDGYELQLRPRSGLSAKNGVVASFGTIDSNYRGPIKACLYNYGCEPYAVREGDKVAQLVLAPVTKAEVEEATGELSETDRGSGGFGSTGR